MVSSGAASGGPVIVSILVVVCYVGGLGLPAPTRPAGCQCTSPEQQQHFSRLLKADMSWFTLTRRSTLDRTVKQVMDWTGPVITVHKRGSRVAACKGSFRTGQLRAIQNKEHWCVWASHAAIGMGTRTDLMR